MLIQAPRGTKDILGDDIQRLNDVENCIRNLCNDFGVSEIRTPVFEHTELFQRGVGETTDVVQKEMYTFVDKGERSLTLKPEGTAGVARAFIEHKLYAGVQPCKLFYITPAFRYERPQSGRYRQFHQFGVEVFGSASASCEVEVISLVYELFRRLNLKNIELHINSLGGNECRKKYNEILKNYIGDNLASLCPTCQERYEKNPLRVLDCKVNTCKEIIRNAPSTIESLDVECREHFEMLKTSLHNLGIPFVVDDKIVRGLDYYTRTVFEFISNDIGALGTICGGGRYDNLIEQYGGPKTPAVGFAIGIERLLLAMESQKVANIAKKNTQVFAGFVGEGGFLKSQSLVFELRKQGISAETDILSRSVKSQLKYADKMEAKFSFIIGDDDLEKGFVSVKNMETGEQSQVEIAALVNFFIQKEN